MRAVNGVIGSKRRTSSTARGASSGLLGQQRPLLRVVGEQPQRVGELRLGRVDAADQDVEDEVDELDVGEPVALLLGGDQRGDEVLAGLRAAAVEQLARVRVELGHRLLDGRALLDHAHPELALDQVRPLPELLRVVERRAHNRRDHLARVGLAEGGDGVAAALVLHARPQLLEEPAHRRPPLLDRARGEGGVDESAQPPVVLAVDVEDVAADLLVERTVVDAEDLGDLQPRERERLRAQEELAGLPLQGREAERHRGDPALLAQLAHGGVEALAAQLRVGVVERGELELGHGRHGRREPKGSSELLTKLCRSEYGATRIDRKRF